MYRAIVFSMLLSFSISLPRAAAGAVFESVQAARDVELSTDPTLPFWQGARPIYLEKGSFGEPRARYRTEVRSRWTGKNLYLLFICPYEELNLNPTPNTKAETFRLWDWDVAEAFIGTDFHNIRRYKEFEISPQAEWVDLDIDLANPHHEDGWTWNSGFGVAARIDASAKIWYGAMRIPFAALQDSPPAAGGNFRVNLFRSQGPKQRRVEVMWQPTRQETFHVPESFGLLRLTE
jgi:hypothetical protein